MIALPCCFLCASSISGEKESTSWIPEDALAAAQRFWVSFHEANTLKQLHNMYEFTDKADVERCELRNGHQIVIVDYENYEPGAEIYDHFDMTGRGSCQFVFGFCAYLDGRQVGEIRVAHRQGSWQFSFAGGYSGLDKENRYDVIFNKYPATEGYRVYKEAFGEFFAVKDSKVISAYAIDYSYPELDSDHDRILYVETDPVKLVLKQKERLKAFRDRQD
jgi:hypothetical protein